MSKTIKQIADELGVSKTAIRNKIKQSEKQFAEFAETVCGVIYINEIGESFIKQAFIKSSEKQFTESIAETNSDMFAVLKQLEAVIDMLKVELSEKNKQIAELQKLLDQQQQLQLQQQKAIPVLTEKSSLRRKIFKIV